MRLMKLLQELGEEWRERLQPCQRDGGSASFTRTVNFRAALILCFLCLSFSNAQGDTLFKPDSTCARSFIYRNRTYAVDSSRKADGEGLRFLFKKNSQAEELLNDYQASVRMSYLPAYTGSLGIAMAIGGPLYAGTLSSPLGQRDTRAIFLFSGLFLAVGSYAYGQWALHHKEKTLEKAVETYNYAVPEPERIHIELTPTATGSGGEIKTQVPFQF